MLRLRASVVSSPRSWVSIVTRFPWLEMGSHSSIPCIVPIITASKNETIQVPVTLQNKTIIPVSRLFSDDVVEVGEEDYWVYKQAFMVHRAGNH